MCDIRAQCVRPWGAPVPTPAERAHREQLRPVLRDLVRYYIDRRLSVRRDSITSRRRHRRLFRWVPLWATPYLFFFAVVAVVCHLLLVTVADGKPQVLTEWLLAPLRRLLPPVGMIDFTPIVAWFLLSLLRRAIINL